VTGGADRAERVYVTRGAIVVSPALPDATVREYDPTLTESFAFTWPRAPLGPRLMGATLTGGRRWVTNDSAEFRTQTEINAVDATGPTLVAGEPILGPVITEQRGDLVTVRTGDGRIVVVDFATNAFVRLDGDASSIALVERADDGYVTVTREPGATGDALVFRCVTL
jgi:hypothetical protein